jgi:serine/threonine protein kinase
MDLVDGVALRRILAEFGPASPRAALSVLKGSLQGLAGAHRAGLVHRDYKPENVMVDQAGSSMLVDFGIALRAGERGSRRGRPATRRRSSGRARPHRQPGTSTRLGSRSLSALPGPGRHAPTKCRPMMPGRARR